MPFGGFGRPRTYRGYADEEEDLFGEAEEEEEPWNTNSRTIDIDMEQAFETQMLGMMQLAGMMMAGLGSMMGEEMSEEEFFSRQSYRQRPHNENQDYAPVAPSFNPTPQQQQQQPQSSSYQSSQMNSNQPSAAAPHL